MYHSLKLLLNRFPSFKQAVELLIATLHILPLWYTATSFKMPKFSIHISKPMSGCLISRLFTRFLLLLARCLVLFARCFLFFRPSYVMKIKYKFRKNTIENIIINVLIAWSISLYRFYGQLPDYYSHVSVLST